MGPIKRLVIAAATLLLWYSSGLDLLELGKASGLPSELVSELPSFPPSIVTSSLFSWKTFGIPNLDIVPCVILGLILNPMMSFIAWMLSSKRDTENKSGLSIYVAVFLGAYGPLCLLVGILMISSAKYRENVYEERPPSAPTNEDQVQQLAELQTTVENLRTQLAERDRTIATQQAQIDELKKSQGLTTPACEATKAAATPVRPSMNALLGQIQKGKQLKALTAKDSVGQPDSTASGRPPMNPLLAELQKGKQLKAVTANDSARQPDLTASGRPPMNSLLAELQKGKQLKAVTKDAPSQAKPAVANSAAPSMAQLCLDKVKERAAKGTGQCIDDILANNKRNTPIVPASNANSELQAALARRRMVAPAAN
ncbi:Hypothetical Protein FCC1311_048082 [Hondaea fermentalgiana]|uniref:WH2 domain-containing protein n=1 Tax=Hondaea fermentalgiana TaxID=2315210 RepID=A0A2R5GC62_9STRA|nr:Hypothetical Protein FCC1311_048082 [Hondaea fermentalgiana]|eukprot:GBG28586.1 Hypothetical Protein FCC1311_048082 [Hondaea fermentalgiana]